MTTTDHPRPVIIGLDIGGTSAKAVAVDRSGHLVARSDVPTGPGRENLERVLGLVEETADLARTRGAEVVAVGAVAPGVIDSTRRVVGFASHLGWRDLPLADLVTDRVGARCSLGNDATAAGLAEWRLGAAAGLRNAVHIAIGTGIGASLIVDGHLLEGHTAAAGELGHTTVFPDGEDCPCGRRGCVDAYAAARGIMARYRSLGGDHDLDLPGLVAVLGSDEYADQVWSLAVAALARVIATVTMTLDPQLVVLGGGVALAGGALLGPLRVAVAEELVWKAPPRIEQSRLGTSAGVAGAVVVGLTALESQNGWTLDALRDQL